MQPEETSRQGGALSDDYPTRGLSAAEVADRLARGQRNRRRRSVWAEYGEIVLRNVATLFNFLVVPAAVALFMLDDRYAAWSVSALAVVNTLIGLVQELRAKRHLEQLRILTEPRARARRDGAEQVIPAGDVVVDDCLLLSAGDAVVADGTLIAARFLEVDEALLTGESDPVSRRAGDRLLSGSFCVAGEGAYRAEQVGMESLAQQTADAARRYSAVQSPMQRILDTLIRVLSAIALVLCLIYVVLYRVRGFPQTDLWRMIAATVTSLVPQGLVLMTTLTFTLAALRMSRRGAVVQRLSAVESMASIDILCLDKTGTLTTGKLDLARLRVLGASEDDVRDRLRLFAWASVDAGNKSIQALRAGLGPLPEAPPIDVLDQVPFKSQNRYSIVRWRREGTETSLVLGAMEVLQPLLTASAAAPTQSAWRELLPTGLRLLLFAEAHGDALAPPRDGALQGLQLTPLALLGLSDELRPEAAAVLSELGRQGIGFKILSGDNPETVRATVATLLPALADERVVAGPELESATNPTRLIQDHQVFGRVTPKQKLDIIRILQSQRCQVGMVGDGVNDVLALKRADLGIALGAGASAARTVAGLVLETNDFSLLPATLQEGRAILENLRRAAKLFLLKNVYTLLLILVPFGMLSLAFPYLPQQVTLLNALTIGGPAFVIMLGRPGRLAEDGNQGHFLRDVGDFAIAWGLWLGVVALGVWLTAYWAGAATELQRTLVLSTLIVGGLAAVLRVAPEERRLRWWAIMAVVAYLAVMSLPPTARFFALVVVPGW